jgi:hypothetical protein
MHLKVLAMKRKLSFYIAKLNINNFEPFPILHNHLAGIGIDKLGAEMKSTLETHFLDLQKQFYWYFSEDTIANTWILNPFVIDCSNLPPELSTTAQEELLALSMLT